MELANPVLEVLARKSVSEDEKADSLKWLRYYLDFCSKYTYASHDHDSLQLFLLTLTSKRQCADQSDGKNRGKFVKGGQGYRENRHRSAC